MTQASEQHPSLVLDEHRPQDRRVALATVVGTSIEWYDYFIYANCAALVFGPQFFKAVPADKAQLLSFATIGISFLFRPLGAAVAGHYGDRLGRKTMLVVTLMLMGVSTALIGILPTAATAGTMAPVLLIILRILQGFSAGGEWGGAALMAVEHAPADKRGKFGAFPQIGVPIGLLLATGFLAILSAFTTEAQFNSWGWRIPFLFSLVLIGIGMWIRLGVTESPVFEELTEHPDEVKMPLGQVFKYSWRQVLQGAFTFMGNGVAGYMVTGGFIVSYATKTLHMPKGDVLNLVTLSCVVWGLSTWFSGVASDRLGRTLVYKIGFVLQLAWVFPLFMMVGTKSLLWTGVAMCILAIPLGMTYGPQAALFAEMFPTAVRYSGASIAYALGSILGGAFAPMIAQALVNKYHDTKAISTYLFIVTALALLATFTIRDRTGKRLDKDAPDLPKVI